MSFRPQRGLALGPLFAACLFGFAAMTTAAEARPSKRGYAQIQLSYGDTEFAHSNAAYAYSGYAATRRVATRRSQRVAAVESSVGPSASGASSLVAEARRWIGTNPTGKSSLWCGDFMNFVLRRTGHRPLNSSTARAFASYGRRLPGPQVGAIAVMTRGPTGGHVGIVSGFDPSGNPIIISGNVNKRVEEIPFPRRIIFAYVTP